MLRMAVVGLGMGGSYGACLHECEGVEFAAMCDKDQEKIDFRVKAYKDEIGAEPKAYLDLDEMLKNEKLDGVLISTPSSTHHALAVKAAEAGVNVFIDKPVDINSENIDKIEAAVKKAGVLCGVNYPQRCAALNTGIKHAIENELVGKPLIIDFRMKWYRTQEYYDKGGWRGTWAVDGGGSLMNQGAHPMDLLCWLAGKPKTVMGEFAALNHNIETEDWASAIIEFESGIRSSISTTTCSAPKKDETWFEIHGTEGSIFVSKEGVVSSTVEDLEKLAPPAFDYPVEEFVDAVANNRAPLISLEEARWSVELINAVYQSGREGKRVVL